VRVVPSADQAFPVQQREEYGRAGRDPAPLDDAAVEVGDDGADLLLAAQVLERLGQAFGLLAQLERGGQEIVGGHALAAQVVPQPGLGGISLSPLGQRLARARQIVEGPPLRRLVDLPVDPRGEAEVRLDSASTVPPEPSSSSMSAMACALSW
jgi:hypothetical protein